MRSWRRFQLSIRGSPVVRASAGSETDARPEACGPRQGEGHAEVRKSDHQPARVLRDVAFAVANQALKGRLRGPFVAPESEAIPEGVSLGAVPVRHRELVPFAGLTGNARSATGAQYRSRGPRRSAEARQCTADRSQCVSARGRNSNAGSAESTSFAAGDAQGASRLPCVEREARGWHHGQAMGRAASDNSQGTQNVRNHRRRKCHGEGSPLEGLAFSCAMHAGRQLDLAEAASVCSLKHGIPAARRGRCSDHTLWRPISARCE